MHIDLAPDLFLNAPSAALPPAPDSLPPSRERSPAPGALPAAPANPSPSLEEPSAPETPSPVLDRLPPVRERQSSPPEEPHSAFEDPTPAPPDPIPAPENLLGVAEILQVLNTFDNSARRKLDPIHCCENAHQTLDRILQANRIEPSDFDRELHLPDGFTRRFCRDITSSSTSKEVLKRLLDRVGLGACLYFYQDASQELAREIRSDPSLDRYSLQPERHTTKEHFVLLQITRGTTDSDRAWIYRLQLQSRARPFQMTVSRPFGCVVGRGYEIRGLEPVIDETARASAMDTARTLTEREKEALLQHLEEKEKEEKP